MATLTEVKNGVRIEKDFLGEKRSTKLCILRRTNNACS